MAVVDIPDELLERMLAQFKDRRKRLAYRVHSGERKGRVGGTIRADQRRLQDLDELVTLLEAAARDDDAPQAQLGGEP